MRRWRRDLVPPFFRLRDAAVPALALLELGERLEEVPGPEIGPEHGRHVDLGVRDLPEQVVRDAHLAARADEEIRVGHFLEALAEFQKRERRYGGVSEAEERRNEVAAPAAHPAAASR